MSKKGGSQTASPQAEAYAQQMAGIGTDIWNMAKPSYSNLASRYSNFLGAPGSFDYTQSPMWIPGKSATEGAYRQAMQNVIANTPSGGAMTSAIGNLEASRAQDLSNLASGIASDEYNKAYGFAAGSPQMGMSGLGGAAGTMSNLAGQQAGAQAQQVSGKYGALGSLGQGAGFMLGSKAGRK